MVEVEEINSLIDQAVESLINDVPEKSAEALEELAYICAKAGLRGQELFESIRKSVIVNAEAKSDRLFIKEKLKVAEEIARSKRLARAN